MFTAMAQSFTRIYGSNLFLNKVGLEFTNVSDVGTCERQNQGLNRKQKIP